MQYTTNFSLKKPQYADEADIEIINDNSDDIDNLIHQNRAMIGPAFDSTKAYVVGNPVVYLGELFVFIADKAAGAWDATKVEPTTAAEIGGGGVSALADLDDVEITSPTDGQALLYDDSDDKWKNQNLPDVSVTKTATGNPIEITDAAAAPIVKCVTQITGSQDLHGYDKPWVGGAGKNKLPLIVDDIKAINTTGTWSGNVYTLNGVTFTINTDGDGNVENVTVSGVVSNTTVFNLYDKETPFPFGQTFYNATGCPEGGGQASNYKFDGIYYAGGSVIALFTDTGSGASIDFSALENASRFLVRIVVYYGAQLPKTFYPMFRLSTETDSTFAPYSNLCPITAYTEGEIEVTDGDGNTTTHTTTFPSAIYRGSEDVVNGEVTVNKIVWTRNTSTMNNSEIYPGWANSGIKSILGSGINTNFPNSVMNIGNVFNINTTGALDILFLSTLDYGLSQSEWIALAIDVQIVVELPTPTTSSVTPTNLPIRTLSGYNHIESSTGEMEIEYITENYQPLVDLIQSSSHVYSTAEQVVGKWIDGKDIYEKTFELQSEVTLTANQWNSITGVSLSGVETPISAEIRGSRGTSVANVDFMDSPVSVWGTSGTEKVKSITFRYTKATANRSLSTPVNTQKAQIEPLDEKEEVPTEEENAVETPVEEKTEEENEEER